MSNTTRDIGDELDQSAAPSAVPSISDGSDDTVHRIEAGPAERHPRRYLVRRQRIDRALAWTVPVVLIGLWQISAWQGWSDTRFFPAPSTVATTSVELVENGILWDAVWVSTKRILIGFGFGVVSGVLAGLLLGVFSRLRAALEPTLMALYVVPKLAILPLLLLIFGLGEAPMIIIVAVTVFFFMWVQTMETIIATPTGYIEAMESFGASRWQTFRYVYLPAAMPQIFVSMRLCAGISILVMVGVEFVQGNNGIGHLIWNSWSLFIATRMYVGIVTVALMGLLFAGLVKVLGRVLLPWAPNDKTHGVS